MTTRSKEAGLPKGKPQGGAVAPTTGAATSSSAASTATSGSSSGPKTSRVSDRSKTTTTATTSSMTGGAKAKSSTGLTSGGATSTTLATTALTSTTSTPPTNVKGTPPQSANGETDPAPPTLTKQSSINSTPSSTENVSQVDASRCVLCSGEMGDSPDELMTCLCCGGSFHARCANLPQTPEEGDLFCRWDCFSAYRKNQGVPPKTPLGDFSRLAARVQSILGDTPRRSGPPPPPPPTHPSLHQGPTSSREIDSQARMRERGKRNLHSSGSRSRSPSPLHSRQVETPLGGRPANGYGGGGGGGGGGGRRYPDEMPPPRRPSPSGRSPVSRPLNHHQIDLTNDDEHPLPPRSPRSRTGRSSGQYARDDGMYDDGAQLRTKRPKYVPETDPMGNGVVGSRRESYNAQGRRMHGAFENGASGSDIPPHYPGGGLAPAYDATKGDPRQGMLPASSMADHRTPQAGIPVRGPPMQPVGPRSSRLPSLDSEHGTRPSSGRSSRGSGGTRYVEPADEYEGAEVSRAPPTGSSRSRPSSAEHFVEGSSGRRVRAPLDVPPSSRHAQAAMPPAKYNIPWQNPAAFPPGLRERFNCTPDNVNGVFRIDLSPVFTDKTMHLYQSEIDFFFRCFESADVSLVVKGMASELNQYIWAWPFILESCSSETHFSFDHFQFRHKPGQMPELEYVGELRLSMAAYNTYLERYLSDSMAKEVVVLENHLTKKPITLIAAENIIALNDLVIADHCAQLYNDLIKSFQWDVFAGGIHCLLQYLPQASRHKRFSSPLLHFNFPGARGRLRDPGNGTTDQAYQVLVGSLELVIFERLEPKDRDAFHRVLRSAGYDAEKKSMLLDSHLRVLRDAGFAWSTVLLNDGEFVHVNKGRLHFWRVVEPEIVRRSAVNAPIVNAPCVFLSWEWVYQGVSQRGISTECWFAMKNASLCTGGWAFDPRRAIVEAAKCGVAIVRTGQFLNLLSGPSAPPVLMELAFTGPSPATIDRDVITQRQEQMVLFLESILPCMDAIVEEEFELGLVKDDSEDFRKVFDDEIMWNIVDTALSARLQLHAEYECGICGLELTNIYKQCLGCTVHARRSRPNVAYQVFRICLRCHAQPEHHHFKPRALHGFYDKLCSSEGHTGLLPATRRYQAERSYFKCRCMPYVRCADCGGCESCCCLCHTLFQTRFRFTAPEHLAHLRSNVMDVIKRHKQQLPR